MLDSHPAHLLRRGDALPARPGGHRGPPLAARWPATASRGPGGWSASASLYLDFQAEVLARTGKARWAEKDPTYTLHLAFIEELFPDALYVHLLRDGHDVVASFRDRWGYRSAARAARGEWARYVEAAHGPGASPRRLAASSSSATSASWPSRKRRAGASSTSSARPGDPEVLDFDPAEHTATERYRWFTAQRRRAAGETTTIYRSRVGAGGRSLDPVLRTLLRRRHGGLLRELGYLGDDGRT